jgi:hypothetical protein
MRADAYVSFELRDCFACFYFLLLSMDVFYKTILKLHVEVEVEPLCIAMSIVHILLDIHIDLTT